MVSAADPRAQPLPASRCFATAARRPTPRSRPCSRSTSSSRKAPASAAAATFSIQTAAERPSSYDGRETAPAAATGTWFFKDGQPMAFSDAQPGGKSVGVPGNVRMMALAHRDHGKLPWARAVPARDQARPRRLRDHARGSTTRSTITARPAPSRPKRAAFSTIRTGAPKPVGTMVKQPGVRGAIWSSLRRAVRTASTSARTRRRSPRPSAAARTIRRRSRRRHRDLRRQAASRAVCGTYRGYRICGMGPSSSGGTTLFATLKQLRAVRPVRAGPHSPTAWHLIAEFDATRLRRPRPAIWPTQFRPRCRSPGLTDPAYLASRSALISPDQHIADATAGTPAGARRRRDRAASQPERGDLPFRRGRQAGATSRPRPRPSRARSGRASWSTAIISTTS